MLRKKLLGGLWLTVTSLSCCASAHAASGAPVTVSPSGVAGTPSVAVAASGNALVAWGDDVGNGTDLVHYCILAPGQTSCPQVVTLTPTGSGFRNLWSVKALVSGSSPETLSILANVDVGDPTTNQQVQEWTSTDGGQTFNPVNGGKAIASGNPGTDTRLVNAVALPGGTNIGFGFDSPNAGPTFHAAPVANPATCGRTVSSPAACPTSYATLQPASDQDQVSNPADGANFAANSSGVLGIFNTNYTSGNLGCSNALTIPFGTAFVYGTGNESATNNYNVSPGSANTAWVKGVTQGDCNVDYPAVGAGPSGFGVLELNDLTGNTQYHRFNTTTRAFDTAPVVVSSTIKEQQPSVSQDGAGGVYATYVGGGNVNLSYSFDGGSTWSGPGSLGSDDGVAHLTSSINAAGQGWAAWTQNGVVRAQQFVANDSVISKPTTLSTSQTAGATTGASIAIAAGTTGETDRATIAGDAAGSATGTMTYALYADSKCTSAVAQSTVAVNGATAPASAPITAALAPGAYYWKAVYGGNAGSTQGAVGNSPSSTACGDEVLTVLPAGAKASPGPGATTPGPSATAPALTAKAATAATTDGKTLAFDLTCAATPCHVTVDLTTGAVTSARATEAKAKKTKAKAVTIAKGTFTLKKKSQKVKLTLSKAGRSYLRKHHDRAKVKLALTQRFASGATSHKTTTLSIKKAKARH